MKMTSTSKIELAQQLFGKNRLEGSNGDYQTYTTTATAVSNSVNGTVSVIFTPDVIGEEDYEDGTDVAGELPTTVVVHAGDEVIVTMYGGIAKDAVVTGLVGEGDATDVRLASVELESLKVQNLTAEQLEATNAYIESLVAGEVTALSIVADHADVATLKADTADISTIRANAAKVQNLTAAQLEADHATVGSLDTNYAKIDMANVNNAWIQNGTIKDAAISDGMINSVSANKLTAGTIDASNITVTNLNADNITTGTINGQRIGEGSLSLDKLSEDVYTESEVDAKLSTMQTQIDGAIETWTGTDMPTLNNSPAVSWDTDDKKDQHVGDVYFVVNSQSQQNGYNYRFAKSGSTYSWQLIKDNDVTNALQRLETAEGKITTFDSDISMLKTDTGTLKTKTDSLETSLGDKVDTSTFNDLSSTVDDNTATITSLSTVVQNNGLTSSTNITNTVNQVSQSASGNSSKISQLTTTLGTNADGTTKDGDVMHRTSAIEQDILGFKSEVSSTYATQETVTTLSSNLGQTATDIRVEISSLSETTQAHDAALSNSYSKEEVDTAIAAASEDSAASVDELAESLNDAISSAQTAANSAAQDLEDYKTEVSGYISFGLNESGEKTQLELGMAGSDSKTRITNERMSFMYGDEEVAYVGGSEEGGFLYMANAEVTSQLKMGQFAWIPRDNGNLSLKWVGTEVTSNG